jgi:hypothetical protein
MTCLLRSSVPLSSEALQRLALPQLFALVLTVAAHIGWLYVSITHHAPCASKPIRHRDQHNAAEWQPSAPAEHAILKGIAITADSALTGSVGCQLGNHLEAVVVLALVRAENPQPKIPRSSCCSTGSVHDLDH